MTSTDEWIQAWMGAPEHRRKPALETLKGFTGEVAHNAAQTEPYRSAKYIQSKYGVSGTSLWRWRIPYTRIGNRIRYLESTVDEYMRSEAFQMRLDELREARTARAHNVNSTTNIK